VLCIVVECRTADDEVRRRLLARVADPTSASDATWQIYLSQRVAADPVTECDPWQHVVIDTTGELSDVTAQARTVLDERLSPTPFRQRHHQLSKLKPDSTPDATQSACCCD
jgi:hypothetical protein